MFSKIFIQLIPTFISMTQNFRPTINVQYKSVPKNERFYWIKRPIWQQLSQATTRQRWESRLYPQPKQVLDLVTPKGCKAELTYVKTDRPRIEPATCQSQVQRPTAAPPRNTKPSNSHKLRNLARITYSGPLQCSHMNRKAHVLCNCNHLIETEGLLMVTGSHVGPHRTCDNISETVHNRDAVNS